MRPNERASGTLGTVFGVAVLMGAVALAADVGVGLWVRSSVDAVASDLAHELASLPDAERTAARRAAAVERARAVLGPHGRRVRVAVGESAGSVTVRVQSPAVGLLPRLAGGGSTVAGLDRTVVVRKEDR